MAEILHEAGVPAGVFNLVDGDGPTVGAALSSHRASTWCRSPARPGPASWWTRPLPTRSRSGARARRQVPNIILEGAPLEQAVGHGVMVMMNNTGQSCNAPSRDAGAAPAPRRGRGHRRGRRVDVVVGDPADDKTAMGRSPANCVAQGPGTDRERHREGARLVCGGPGRRGPGARLVHAAHDLQRRQQRHDHRPRGDLRAGALHPAVRHRGGSDRVANDTPYGLSAYVFGDTHEHAVRVGARIRAGNVHLNGASLDVCGSFGGYKQSGLGREWGAFGSRSSSRSNPCSAQRPGRRRG